MAYTAFSMYIPADALVSAVAAYLQLAGSFMQQSESAPWLPSTGLEWRAVTPLGSSAFDTLKAGVKYVQIEVVSILLAVKSDTGLGAALQQLQAAFTQLGGIPHAGKDYGHNAQGVPFQVPYKFYAKEQVDLINAKLDEWDPKRVFSAGSTLFDFAPSKYVQYSRG